MKKLLYILFLLASLPAFGQYTTAQQDSIIDKKVPANSTVPNTSKQLNPVFHLMDLKLNIADLPANASPLNGIDSIGTASVNAGNIDYAGWVFHFYTGGVLHNYGPLAGSIPISLAATDQTRIDLMVANSNGTITIITGTESSSAGITPPYSASTQLPLAQIFVYDNSITINPPPGLVLATYQQLVDGSSSTAVTSAQIVHDWVIAMINEALEGITGGGGGGSDDIPLSGTVAGRPVTGNIEMEVSGGQNRIYTGDLAGAFSAVRVSNFISTLETTASINHSAVIQALAAPEDFSNISLQLIVPDEVTTQRGYALTIDPLDRSIQVAGNDGLSGLGGFKGVVEAENYSINYTPLSHVNKAYMLAAADSIATLKAGSGLTASSVNTLTNKSISGATNTFSAIPQSTVTNLVSDLAAKVDKETYSAITVSGSTFTLTGASKQNPLFTSTATTAFTIALSGVTAGQHGEWVVTVNTASSVVVTMPVAFTNRQFGETMAATYTLPAGTSGRVVTFYYATTNGTTLDWDVADSNFNTVLNAKIDTGDSRLTDARLSKSLGGINTEIIATPGTTSATTVFSYVFAANTVRPTEIYNVEAIVTSSQVNSKTVQWKLTDGTTTILLGAAVTWSTPVVVNPTAKWSMSAGKTAAYTVTGTASGVLLTQASNTWTLQLVGTLTNSADNIVIRAVSINGSQVF